MAAHRRLQQLNRHVEERGQRCNSVAVRMPVEVPAAVAVAHTCSASDPGAAPEATPVIRGRVLSLPRSALSAKVCSRGGEFALRSLVAAILEPGRARAVYAKVLHHAALRPMLTLWCCAETPEGVRVAAAARQHPSYLLRFFPVSQYFARTCPADLSAEAWMLTALCPRNVYGDGAF